MAGLLVRAESESLGAWAARLLRGLKSRSWTTPIAEFRQGFSGPWRWPQLLYTVPRLVLTRHVLSCTKTGVMGSMEDQLKALIEGANVVSADTKEVNKAIGKVRRK